MKTGQGRERLLTEIFALLETEGWRYSADTGWKDWDRADLRQPVLERPACGPSPSITADRSA